MYWASWLNLSLLADIVDDRADRGEVTSPLQNLLNPLPESAVSYRRECLTEITVVEY